MFCGFGEPTLRLKLVLEVSGYIQSRHGRVDALSVSMNAHNETVYNRHCRPALRGSYQAMLSFLEQAPRYINEVTATAMDGLQGVDSAACQRLAMERGVQFRRRVIDVVGKCTPALIFTHSERPMRAVQGAIRRQWHAPCQGS